MSLSENKCWYKQVCPKVIENCFKNCPRYYSMKIQIDKCGMPNVEKYINTKLQPLVDDKENYRKLKEIKDNIVDFVSEGRNLNIFSEGFINGKTTWSLKLMYKYLDDVWAEIGSQQGTFYINVPSFIAQYSSFEEQTKDEYKDIRQSLLDANLVVWDDISNIKLNQLQQDHINTIIDQRISNNKANIFNGIFDKDNAKRVGERLANRLENQCINIELFGKNRKYKNVQEEC